VYEAAAAGYAVIARLGGGGRSVVFDVEDPLLGLSCDADELIEGRWEGLSESSSWLRQAGR
jgi:hypothetical protein